jgi:O-antigen/teichoic acid export membrane protein
MGIIKQILQGSIVLFIFKISGTASNFLVHILVSRVYGSTALGMYSLFISAMTFLSMFSIVGLDLYVIRKIAEIEDDCLSSLGFIRKSLRFVIIYSATLGCIVYFISPMLREHLFKHDLGRVYIILLSIIISIYSIQVVMSSVLRGFGDVVRYAIYQSFLVQVALLLVMVFLVLVINLRIDPAYVFCSVLTLIVCFQGWGLIRYICNRYHLQARQVLSYGKYAEKIIM